ncbi:MAG TPA: AarF/UbiB family protein [Polyangium sp.]|nr:AarF/UbiB family protein [Polyangium sp.]
MLKKKRIPTPIFDHKPQWHDLPKPVRFRALHILVLCIQALWYVLMMRFRKSGEKYAILGLARMVTASVERLGGLWIKSAQLVAMRRDIFPKEFCDELSRLHDRAHGFPGEIAIKIIEEQLGREIKEVFREFDPQPIAAASIGQVHVAQLWNKKKVAVKVQRPNIIEIFNKDLAILSVCLSAVNFFGILPWAGWDEMFDNLKRSLKEELDYRLEVAAMRRMRRNLKVVDIISPKPCMKYCTERLIVMEFLDGVLMSDYLRVLATDPVRAKAWLKENKINPRKFGHALYISFAKQLLEDNFLHGDLHPGNIMMLRKSRIAFIDFGSICSLDAGFITNYNNCMQALVQKDFGKFTDTYLTTLPSIPATANLNELRKIVVRTIENWDGLTDAKGVPYEQRSLTAVLTTMAKILGDNELRPSWSNLRLMRTMTALDASLRYMIPNVDFFKMMRRFYGAQGIRLIVQVVSKDNRDNVQAAIEEASKIPAMLGENFFYQADSIRKRAMSFQADISKAARIGMAVIGIILNIGIIATATAIARYFSRLYDGGKQLLAQLPVRDVFGSMPSFSPGVWIGIIIVALYVLYNMGKVAKILGAKGPGSNPFVQ